MTHSPLRIPFADIPLEGLQVSVDDVSWFPDDELVRRGNPTKVVVSLARDADRVLVVGTIETMLLLTCDRCLAEFASPLKTDFRLVLEVAQADEGFGEEHEVEHEYSPGGFEEVKLDEPVVDLADLLYQQMILALPQKVLCRQECSGICGRCGTNLNAGRCDCPEDDHPESASFAALGRLLGSKK